ncbi:DUF3152 domain-containing protein [Streptomyces calidiresistens]
MTGHGERWATRDARPSPHATADPPFFPFVPPPHDHRDRSGPRPEYLAAFDGPGALPGDTGAPVPAFPDGPAGNAGEASGNTGSPGPDRPAAGPRHGHRAGGRRRRRAGGRPAEGSRAADAGPPDDRGPGTAPGGRGRTITGAAAAAVVTVLAVTVAGPMTEGGDGVAERAAAALAEGAPPLPGGGPVDPGDTAGPGEPEVGERESAAGEPLDFDTWFAEPLEMDPGTTGSGELVPVAGSDPPVDPDARTLLRYRVDVERDLEDMGVDPERFARAVHLTLSDPRGWGNGGERSFARVSSGEYDFVLTLATPGTTHDWCRRSGLDTSIDNVSCDSASTERVVLNAFRWAEGADTFGADLRGYREMLINHEVGHRIGYNHVVCPAEGEPAPVMMQQTKFLTTAGVTCEPNPWPHPDHGADGADGDDRDD